MKTTKNTLSLCPTCYLEIPATITTDERGAVMHKTCPHHGTTEALVERDPLYYLYASGLKAPSIYGGHFVDVTRTCQLRCNPCLPGDAPILKSDMSHVQMKDVRVGDKLVGFPEKGEAFFKHLKLKECEVTAVVETFPECLEITTTRGVVKCSPNHRWLANRRWRRADRMKPGQFISTVSPVVDKPNHDDDFKMGYIAGVTLGDGTIDHRKQGPLKQWDQQYYRLALSDFDILDRVEKFASDLGIKLFRKPYKSRNSKRVQCQNLKPMQMLHISQKAAIEKIESWFLDGDSASYRKGFVSGFFDAEGSCEQKKKTIRMAQIKPNGLLDRIDKYLHEFGFQTSRDSKCTRIKGGQQEVLRFFMEFDPACKRKFNLKSHGVRGKAVIVSVKKLPPQKMYDITTTTGTFVAYGLATHNCYYNLEKSDPAGMFSIEAIVNECVANINRAPFILTGGEPTLHPHFLDVVAEVSKVGPVELLSNGIKLSDAEFFNDVIPMITDRNGVTHLNLSIHHKESDDWKTVIKLARADKIRIESALIVVNSEIEFDKALDMCREMADVVNTFRIKAASRLWNAKQTSERVCVSDMLRWLEKFEKPVVHVAMKNNKPCFFNVLFDRMHLMLVSWYDVTNVDLLEIDCPPTYRARNGEVCNFVTTALINEGMEKKWMRGNRIL